MVISCTAGVISVAVFGLYGAATSKWEMSTKVEESGAFDAFWDSIAFIVNAIVFFYSGAACINFFVRCARAHCSSLRACLVGYHREECCACVLLYQSYSPHSFKNCVLHPLLVCHGPCPQRHSMHGQGPALCMPAGPSINT